MPSAKRTTDHDEIRGWAEERQDQPAIVRGTGTQEDEGILRIDFRGGAGEDWLEHISRDEWFRKFGKCHHAALLQESAPRAGKTAGLVKLVSRKI